MTADRVVVWIASQGPARPFSLEFHDAYARRSDDGSVEIRSNQDKIIGLFAPGGWLAITGPAVE